MNYVGIYSKPADTSPPQLTHHDDDEAGVEQHDPKPVVKIEGRNKIYRSLV
jgi:hypothetical protein